MPKVFVHGNPETTDVWYLLIRELARRGVDDCVLLSPPGFGAPVPAGFGGTRLDHRDWLISELEALGEPVDLVGHDWGAGHTYAVAAARPDLLRSWAADCAGLLHPDYEWHRAAAIWQMPGVGEASITRLLAADPAALVSAARVPEALAPTMAAHLDDRMGRAILRLYRSAVQPAMRQLGEALAAAERRPGLVIDAPADPYVPSPLAHDVAAAVGADLLILEGTGHWWMWEQPAGAADGLVAFWS